MTKSDNIVPLPDMREVEAEAARWVARFEDGAISPSDEPAFQAWCRQSEAHREAYIRLAGLWGAFDRVAELKDYAVAAAVSEASRSPLSALLSRRNALTGLAASVAAVAGAGAVYYIVKAKSAEFGGTFDTALGQQRDVALPDGSLIELNTNSRVEVKFDGARRRIRLLQGEAFFNVAPNKKRPFSVFAGGGVVTAVGTAFAVRLETNKRIDVLVSEGRVALAGENMQTGAAFGAGAVGTANKTPVEIDAGQNAIFEDDVKRIERVNGAALERKLMWRSGMLAYDGEPLSEVVADVSRYAPVHIEIEGEALQRMPVAGFFRVGEVDMMLEGLAELADIEVTRVSPTEIRLSARDKG